MRHGSLTLVASFLVAGLCVPGCGGRADHATVDAPLADARLEGSTRLERNGWIFVHLQGPPAQLGFQHGYLLAPEIADLLRVTRPLMLRQSKKEWAFYRKAAEDMLWPKIDPEYQQEIDGIVEGQKAHGGSADRWDIVAMNAMIELSSYYVPWLDKQSGQKAGAPSPESCSAFIATGSYTRDHRIVMAHNAWTDYIVGSRWNIVFDLVPDKGQRMLMDGLPGVIVSDDDFDVTSAGLLVTETTIAQFEGFDPAGVPEFARARKALQYSSTIDDYVRIMLDGNNGGYANDWLIGDNKTGEVARFELGLKEHTLERSTDGYFAGSNFPVGEKLIKNETTFDPRNRLSSPNARHARWDDVLVRNKGQIDAESAKKFESDAFDIIEKREGPTERSLCGTVETSPRGIPEWDWPPYFPGGTVQAKVITASMAENMKFWGSVGHSCGADFIAADHVAKHPEFAWAKDLLRDLKARPWTEFSVGMR